MKTHIKILFIVVFIALISCDPTRIDTPPSISTEASYFSSVVEFRDNLVSAYAKQIEFYHYNANFASDWPQGIWYLPGDDLTETTGARSSVELFDGSLNPNNGQITWMFDKAYELILRATVTLEKTRTIDFSDFPGAEEIAMMEGETLFLRSLSYFFLINIYGNVPLVTERILTEAEANTPISDKMIILDQIISDLELAVDIVPEAWEAGYAGRVTKNSVRALLTKALVWRANYEGNTTDFTQAIDVFSDITATLMPVYTDNFNGLVENNAESCYEIQASQPTGPDNIFLYNDGPWRGVENMSIFRGMMTLADAGFAAGQASTRFLITDKLFNNFGTDPRISVFLVPTDGFEGKLFQKYTLPGLEVFAAGFDNSANNERILRYGDLKLVAAEAYLKSGDPASAIEQINDVRTRAREWGLASGVGDGVIPADHPTGETNATTIMQWIMDERFVELAGEGHRWWDLKRWHESGDIDLTGWGGGDEHFSTYLSSPFRFDVTKHLVFPLPQAEVERNDAILNNNPGY